MNKKLVATTLALGLLLCAMPASAAEVNQDGGEIGSDIVFEYDFADPTYTITIPSEINLDEDGSEVEIIASDVADHGDQEISVTVAGTNAYRNQFALDGFAPNGQAKTMRYALTSSSGVYMETTGSENPHVGGELVRFSGNGEDSYTITPIITEYTVKGTTYSGSITYGIELV